MENLRYALAVPFDQKDQAKQLGAVWEKEHKVWAVPNGVDPTPFQQWMPQRDLSKLGQGQTPEDAFKDLIEKAGLLPTHFTFDGTIQRCAVKGDDKNKKSGSYVYFGDGDKPGGFVENYKSGFRQPWRFDGPSLAVDDVSSRAFSLQSLIDARIRQEELEALHQVKADEANQRLAKYSPEPPEHHYAARKGVLVGEGVRFARDMMVLPYQDIHGKVWTLQYFSAEEGGDKNFMKDAKKDGTFYAFSPIQNGRPVLVVEGYATGAYLLDMARKTGMDVPTIIVAGNAGALKEICQQVHDLYPASMILIGADNDHELPMRGKANRGIEAAQEAAQLVNGYVLIPEFAAGDSGTDWHDMGQSQPQEATKLFRNQYYAALDHGLQTTLSRLAEQYPHYDLQYHETGEVSGECVALEQGHMILRTQSELLLFSFTDCLNDAPMTVGSRIAVDAREGFWGKTHTLADVLNLCAQPSSSLPDIQDAILSGDDLDRADAQGMTALHHAVQQGRNDLATMLCQNGINVNIVDQKGRTALHIAAYQGQKEVCHTLLNAGADLTIRDSYKNTPVRNAWLSKNQGLWQDLRDAEKAQTQVSGVEKQAQKPSMSRR